MHATKHIEPDPRADGRVMLYGITWSEYEVMLAVRGERAGTRMYYLEGTLEIMNPSAFHEEIKTTVARLLEAYLDEKRIKVTASVPHHAQRAQGAWRGA